MNYAEEIDGLINDYRHWLKDRTSLKVLVNDWIEITTPFLDRHNDCIQLYVRREGSGFKITDDGYTLTDLEISGCKINTPKRQELLQLALNGYGVSNTDGVLSVSATRETFPARKHALIQAILATNDLFYTAQSTVQSLFKEDVQKWLDESEIRYVPNVTLVGLSGYPHQFDFAIPKSRQAPERLLKAISNPNKQSVESLLFAWLDSRESRNVGAEAYAVLNDVRGELAPAISEALLSYDIKPIVWSDRKSFQRTLHA